MLTEFADKHQLGKEFLHDARKWYIPLADNIATHQDSALKPYFLGVNGCQGSGKSTLSDFLNAYLTEQYDLNVVVMSLDDFYLDQSQRSAIADEIHPLFKTRGVPGTHNMTLAAKVLAQLREQQSPISIPRFNKATDNPQPVEQWQKITTTVDVVIFEGWCWGVEPQDENDLAEPINSLEKNCDQTGAWRKYVNLQLQQNYAPLYSLMDYWIMLKAPSFDCVYNWRLEQEHKLAKTLSADPLHSKVNIMNDQQVLSFIQYYQRLTEHALATLENKCDMVFTLNAHRRIIAQHARNVYA
ncbi:kinase [Paraglaciecola sp. 20A4]|uniref:kinase n=1 Tax=Paraglaciecola sp. 20A4 TaxID=2687288 RepID=UPI00140E7639|nr:kinase [Paraglaciecola sp. 20A4]